MNELERETFERAQAALGHGPKNFMLIVYDGEAIQLYSSIEKGMASEINMALDAAKEHLRRGWMERAERKEAFGLQEDLQ